MPDGKLLNYSKEVLEYSNETRIPGKESLNNQICVRLTEAPEDSSKFHSSRKGEERFMNNVKLVLFGPGDWLVENVSKWYLRLI